MKINGYEVPVVGSVLEGGQIIIVSVLIAAVVFGLGGALLLGLAFAVESLSNDSEAARFVLIGGAQLWGVISICFGVGLAAKEGSRR